MNPFCVIIQLYSFRYYYYTVLYWLEQLLDNTWLLFTMSITMLYMVLILRALLKYMRG